jgi:hypothetical protein
MPTAPHVRLVARQPPAFRRHAFRREAQRPGHGPEFRPGGQGRERVVRRPRALVVPENQRRDFSALVVEQENGIGLGGVGDAGDRLRPGAGLGQRLRERAPQPRPEFGGRQLDASGARRCRLDGHPAQYLQSARRVEQCDLEIGRAEIDAEEQGRRHAGKFSRPRPARRASARRSAGRFPRRRRRWWPRRRRGRWPRGWQCSPAVRRWPA